MTTSSSAAERVELFHETDVRPLRATVRRIAANLPFSHRQIDDITLAVCEACMNGVFHATPRVAGPLVTVVAATAADHLAIEVEDQGEGFAVSLPHMPGPMAEHGRGIALMHALMDDVAITSTHSGTCVRMVKYFASPLASAGA